MTVNRPENHERLRREAAKIGIALADDARPLPSIECFGQMLPDLFVWFCRNYANHSGFPHHGWESGFGLLSPFGQESILQRRNAEVRLHNPNWPTHWVIFWHGTDGDYCFSFDNEGHPWVVYWYYNAGYPEGDQDLALPGHYEATDFEDWFADQAGWVTKQLQEAKLPKI